MLEQPIGVRLQPGDVRGKIAMRGATHRDLGDATLVARQKIEAGVRGDAVQPRAEACSALEGLTLLPRPQKRLLNQILGVLERRHHSVALHVELAPVSPRERGERGFISRRRSCDDRTVVGVVWLCVGHGHGLLTHPCFLYDG